MPSNVRYDADQRARAKRENKRLACIQLTGKGGRGGVTFTGPVDDDDANAIRDFMTAFLENRLARRKPDTEAA